MKKSVIATGSKILGFLIQERGTGLQSMEEQQFKF